MNRTDIRRAHLEGRRHKGKKTDDGRRSWRPLGREHQEASGDALRRVWGEEGTKRPAPRPVISAATKKKSKPHA